MGHQYRGDKLITINSTLAIIHGILLSAGKGEAHDVTDALKEMYKGI